MQHNYKINIQTTEDYLRHKSLSINDVKQIISSLFDTLGSKLPILLGQERLTKKLLFKEEEIEYMLYLSSIFKTISECDGFDRHLDEYDVVNSQAHLLTAKTANYFLNRGFEVTLEPPDLSKSGGKPDLLIIKENQKCFIECKRINKRKFFEFDNKRLLADTVLDKTSTCDQVTIYLNKPVSHEEMIEIFNDSDLAFKIHTACNTVNENTIDIGNKITIHVLKKPPIIGSKDSFSEAVMEMILADFKSGTRLPGFVFMKYGRSVGVFGPAPNYTKIWKMKRRKSQNQAPPGVPMIVVFDKNDILGSPEFHEKYWKGVWLTENTRQCSGIAVIDFLADKIELCKHDNPFHQLPKRWL